MQIATLTALVKGQDLLVAFHDSLSLCPGLILLMQGVNWSYEALARDMLELHDPACVTAVHALKCQRDLELEQPQHPTLEDVHETCVACYTKWFQDEHANYPEADLIITVARTEQATRNSGWQFPDPSSNSSANDVADGILQASSLRRLGDPSAHWLSAVSSSEGCSVPDLISQLQQTAATSTFMQSLLFSPECGHQEDMPSMLQHSTPVAALPPHCWRLLAITLQHNIFVVDSEHSRMCCYPCHDGKVDVHGAADYGGDPNAWSIKSWDQPGFFFALGKLPSPTRLSQQRCRAWAFALQSCSLRSQVTHRARHEVPADLRINHNITSDELSVLGGWDVSVKNQVYARLPTGTLLAKMAGCPSRQGYIVFWLLLDPLAFPEFCGMVQQIYTAVPERLEKLREVGIRLWCDLTQCKTRDIVLVYLLQYSVTISCHTLVDQIIDTHS